MNDPSITRPSLGAAACLLAALALAGCEAEPEREADIERRGDTMEMGAAREEPIVPPMGRDTGIGMEGRDTVMAGVEEDTLAAVRPQPPPEDGDGGAGRAVDRATLEELSALIDRTLRDLERARQLLRESMRDDGDAGGAGDTTGAKPER